MKNLKLLLILIFFCLPSLAKASFSPFNVYQVASQPLSLTIEGACSSYAPYGYSVQGGQCVKYDGTVAHLSTLPACSFDGTTITAVPDGQGLCVSPVCTSPQVLSSDGSTCVSPVVANPCSAGGRTLSTGTTAQGANLDVTSVCDQFGCEQKIDMSACAGGTCVGTLGRQTGAQCSNASPVNPPALTPDEQLKQDCLKAGNSFGSINGALACVPKTNPNSEPVTTKGQTVTDANGTQTTTNTTNIYNDNGTVTTNTTTTTSVNGGTPTTSTGSTTSDKPTFCQSNPSDSACTGDTSLALTPAGYTSGHHFYDTKYPQGITGVWDTAKSKISNSSLGTLASNFAPNVGNSGSAPTWTMNFNLGAHMNFGSFTLAPDSNIWAILRIILLISTLFLARSLIFGG